MKRKTSISTVLFLVLYQFAIGQITDNYVMVDDTLINLIEVSLEKGLFIENTRDYINANGNSFDIEKKIYKNFNNSNYLIAYDTASFSNYASSYNSTIRYFDKTNKNLFSISYRGVSVVNAKISENGELIFIHVGSDSEGHTYLYDKSGMLLKEFINQDITISNDKRGEIFYLRDDQIYNKLLIINSNNLHEINLDFNDRIYLGAMSPSNGYFTVRTNDSIHVYNRYGIQQWTIEYENQGLYIFSNGEKYLKFNPYPVGKIQVYKTSNHELLYEVENINYKNKILHIYKFGFINNSGHFWASCYSDNYQIFNFINSSGELMNTYKIDSKVPTRNINIIKQNDLYIATF